MSWSRLKVHYFDHKGPRPEEIVHTIIITISVLGLRMLLSTLRTVFSAYLCPFLFRTILCSFVSALIRLGLSAGLESSSWPRCEHHSWLQGTLSWRLSDLSTMQMHPNANNGRFWPACNAFKMLRMFLVRRDYTKIALDMALPGSSLNILKSK